MTRKAFLPTALCVLLTASAALAEQRRAFTGFVENPTTPFAAAGASTTWTDADWADMTCPNTGTNSIVTGLFSSMSYGVFVQIGSVKSKWKAGANTCVSEYRYFWEWSNSEVPEFKNATIEGLRPPSNHKFALTFGTEGCANSVLCWHYKIDGSVKHRCCGADPFTYAASVSANTECVWQGQATGCQSGSGSVVRDNLKVKVLGDEDTVWEEWRGRDLACVEHGKHARGKWNSATSAVGGFNVSMNNSIDGCVTGPGIAI